MANLKEFDFDNISETKIAPEIIEAMLPFFQKKFSKKELYPLFEKGLRAIYQMVDADHDDHFVLTSSHAEAINHILYATYLDVTQKTGKNHFITSSIDEAPQVMAMSRSQEMGTLFDMAPVNNEGFVTVEALRETITPRTVLVSLSSANGLTGVLQPITEIAELCKERGVLLHVDISHVLSKKRVSFKNMAIDFLTFNGGLLNAPTMGALFIKKQHIISPFIVGGSEQGGLRGGSYNYPLFFALAKASEWVNQEMDALSIELSHLRDFFEKTLLEHIPEAEIHFKNGLRAPHISAVKFPHVHSDALLYFLNKKNVLATQGGGHFQKIAHILRASSITSNSSLSFSFNHHANEKVIEEGVKIIAESYRFLQKNTVHI